MCKHCQAGREVSVEYQRTNEKTLCYTRPIPILSGTDISHTHREYMDNTDHGILLYSDCFFYQCMMSHALVTLS